MNTEILIPLDTLNKGIVVQHNDLIESCHRMSLIEMRIMCSFISSLRRDKDNDISRVHVISITDYNSIYNTDNTYENIQHAVDKLFKRSITLNDGKKIKTRINFVDSAQYVDGQIKIQFTTSIMTLLEKLGSHFTSLPLDVISNLNTTYGIRVLELLKQYEAIGKRTITIDDLRSMFELTNSYNKYADFRKRVIDTAVNDINNNTDYSISYTQNKAGRKIQSITFDLKK